MKVVLIHSFKGGSGKTIFSINLAKILSELGQKVLLIETDFVMPAFQSVFPEINPDIFLNDYLISDLENLNRYIYQHPLYNNLSLVFADEIFKPSHKIFGQDQDWFISKKTQLSNTLDRLEFDWVIFDTTPGSSLFVINLLLVTDIVFLLMRSDIQSIRGSENLIERVYKKTVNLGNSIEVELIINQVPKVGEMRQILKNLKDLFLAKYPFIENIYSIEFEHQTSYLTSIQQFILPSSNPTYQQFYHIAKSLTET